MAKVFAIKKYRTVELSSKAGQEKLFHWRRSPRNNCNRWWFSPSSSFFFSGCWRLKFKSLPRRMESNYQYCDCNLLVWESFLFSSALSSLRIEIIIIKVRFSLRLLFYYEEKIFFLFSLLFASRSLSNNWSGILMAGASLWYYYGISIPNK